MPAATAHASTAIDSSTGFAGQQVEGQSFSPLFAGDFHHLPRFGKLTFEPAHASAGPKSLA